MSDRPAGNEGVWDADAQARWNGKRYSEYYDPCQEAASRSLRCLHRNGGDREMCSDFFQAYRDCKKEWTDQMKEAKRKARREKWF